MTYSQEKKLEAIKYGLIDYVEIIRNHINNQNENFNFGPATNEPAHLVESTFLIGDFKISLGTNVSSVHNTYVEISIDKTIENKVKIYNLYERTNLLLPVKNGHRYYTRLEKYSSLMTQRSQILDAVNLAYDLLHDELCEK